MWLNQFGSIDSLVFYIFCALAAVVVLVGLISLLVPCCLPSVRSISPGGTMDFFVIFGGILLSVTVVLQGLDDSLASVSVLTTICQLYPAILLIGLTMFLGGLFVKAASIHSYQWFKRPSAISDEWKPNLGMWGMLIVVGIAAVIWCVLFTPTLAEVSFGKYLCYGEFNFEWTVATSAWHGLILLLAFIMMPLQCKKSRGTPGRSESTALGWVIMNTLLCVVAGFVVYFLFDGTPTLMYWIFGGLTLWIVLFANILLLAGKVALAKKYSKADKYIQEDEEDERYDTIKDDRESGERLEMGTTSTSMSFVNKGYNTGDTPETFNY